MGHIRGPWLQRWNSWSPLNNMSCERSGITPDPHEDIRRPQRNEAALPFLSRSYQASIGQISVWFRDNIHYCGGESSFQRRKLSGPGQGSKKRRGRSQLKGIVIQEYSALFRVIKWDTNQTQNTKKTYRGRLHLLGKNSIKSKDRKIAHLQLKNILIIWRCIDRLS